jgi:Amt family ammonium transporter
LFTAIFAQASVAGFDGFTHIPGGWLDGHYIQLAWHIADSVAGFVYSFIVTVSTAMYFYVELPFVTASLSSST